MERQINLEKFRIHEVNSWHRNLLVFIIPHHTDPQRANPIFNNCPMPMLKSFIGFNLWLDIEMLFIVLKISTTFAAVIFCEVFMLHHIVHEDGSRHLLGVDTRSLVSVKWPNRLMIHFTQCSPPSDACLHFCRIPWLNESYF